MIQLSLREFLTLAGFNPSTLSDDEVRELTKLVIATVSEGGEK